MVQILHTNCFLERSLLVMNLRVRTVTGGAAALSAIVRMMAIVREGEKRGHSPSVVVGGFCQARRRSSCRLVRCGGSCVRNHAVPCVAHGDG